MRSQDQANILQGCPHFEDEHGGDRVLTRGTTECKIKQATKLSPAGPEMRSNFLEAPGARFNHKSEQVSPPRKELKCQLQIRGSLKNHQQVRRLIEEGSLERLSHPGLKTMLGHLGGCVDNLDCTHIYISIKPTKVGQEDWGEGVRTHLISLGLA